MSDEGKRLLLGITGGVAAFKAAELVRLLAAAGHKVRVVMTEAAQRFVGVATMQALSGQPVMTDLWDSTHPDGMAHIGLSREADAIVVVPATADFLAKLAAGICDDLLSTLCLARECPLLVAPAMNRQMWENPATQRNMATLGADGVHVLGPVSGAQACGELGQGRMLEAWEIADDVQRFFRPKLLAGRTVLITAGPTFEAIDPVRGITNLSSGKMGYAVARAAAEAGARVTLISGPTGLPIPRHMHGIQVDSAREMRQAVLTHARAHDVFIAVAAVADYRPIDVSLQKLKKDGQDLTLQLTANPDILAEVAGLEPGPFCVGFAAETERVVEHAEAKRRRKRLPLLVANLAQEALGRDETSLVLLDDAGAHPIARSDKLTLARHLIEHLAGMLQQAPHAQG